MNGVKIGIFSGRVPHFTLVESLRPAGALKIYNLTQKGGLMWRAFVSRCCIDSILTRQRRRVNWSDAKRIF